MIYRRSRRTISVEVDIDISEVMSEFSDDDLASELKERRKHSPATVSGENATFREALEDARDALLARDIQEALSIIENAMAPHIDLKMKYDSLPRDPVSKRPVIA